LEEFNLYTWFGDNNLDSYAPRGIAMNRALSYKKLPYSINFLYLPEEAYKAKLAFESIPFVKYGNLRVNGLWSLCELLDEITMENLLIPNGGIRNEVFSFTFWAMESLSHTLTYYRWVNEDNFKQIPDYYKKLSGRIFQKELLKKVRSDILMTSRRYSEVGKLDEAHAADFLRKQLKVISYKLENNTFLFGESICVADIAVYSVLSCLFSPDLIQSSGLFHTSPLIIEWMHEFEEHTKGKYTKKSAA